MATTISRKSGARKASGKLSRSGGGSGMVAGLSSVLRGVLIALVVTLLGVVVLALVIRWTTPSDMVVSILNQALKLLAIAGGCWICLRNQTEGTLIKGALIGFIYMLLGVVAYALLSGLPIQLSSYLADLGMGVAAGGLCGMIFPGMGTK